MLLKDPAFEPLNFYTLDENIKSDPTYKIIHEVITEMVKSGAIFLGAGYCVSIGDMVRTALKHRGIDSKLVDCQATFTDMADGKPRGNSFIGFPGVINPGEIDTHVVVITSTTPSFLIDASLAKILPGKKLAIIEPVKFNSDNQLTLISVFYDEIKMKVTYQQKKNQFLGFHHQQSIIDRIHLDDKVSKDINNLRKLLYICMFFSFVATFNFMLKASGIWAF